jgi:hypothetical protein
MEHREKPQIHNSPSESTLRAGSRFVLWTPIFRAGSQFRNSKLNSWLLTPYVCLVPYAVRLAPKTLAAYAAKVAVDPTQLTANVSPNS